MRYISMFACCLMMLMLHDVVIAITTPDVRLEAFAPKSSPTPTRTPHPPTPTPNSPQRLIIDTIALDQPLIPVGLDSKRIPIVPKHDVGWYIYSARPGEGENIVLWGHVLRFKETPSIPAPFARLSELAIGDTIEIVGANGKRYTYKVVEKIKATPDQIAYILPQGRERLTLVSCIGDKVIVDGEVELTHRLITIAEPTTK